jgi:cell fate regulator YaaT (PSP1 superfamily)
MNAFDWLSHMGIPSVDKFDLVEVKFKGGRKEYYRNVDFIPLTTGDPIVLDVPNGHHIGYVSLQGELVRLQMQKRKIKNDDNILRIYRVANQKDLEKWEEARNREIPTLYRTKQIIDELKLEMKLSDVEFQADNSKATFFYSAEDRVDFRELIKLLASEFRIRVEMRQISLRQEAGRLGGIGVCGRELCCSTWIYDFKSVNTSAARYQNLSLNPSKLSGQCGRLKCCLNYELDTYMAALSDIPEVEKPLLTEVGPAKLQKTDIFRKLMWFSYNNDNNWHSITCDRVREIQELNAKGTKPTDLKNNHTRDIEDQISKSNLELEILDKKFSGNKRKKKKKSRGDANNPAFKKEAAKPDSQRQKTNPNQNQPRKNNPSGRTPRSNAPQQNADSKPVTPKAQEGSAEQKPRNKRNNKRRFNPKNKGDQNPGQ